MSIQFRRLTPKDAEKYKKIRLEALRTLPQFFANSYAIEALEPLTFFRDVLNHAHVVGAFDGNKLVGCGVFFLMWPKHLTELHKGMISGVYVKPDYQRRGLARGITLHLLEVAKKQCKQVHVAMYSSNEKSRALFDQLGFVEYGREPNGLFVEGEYYDKVWLCKQFLKRK